MSELIQKNDNRATIRWKLLTGASALALTAYVSSASLAKADDSDRPLIWVELGGQLSRLQDSQEVYTPPFVALTPPGFTPPQNAERPPRYGFDETGKISFQPDNSDWVLSASIRYGRASSGKHVRHQSYPMPYNAFVKAYGTSYGVYYYFKGTHPVDAVAARFTDAAVKETERHAILDFQAGKDLGLGLFGRDATSTLNVGVRIAQFHSNSRTVLGEGPDWQFQTHLQSFHLYYHGYGYDYDRHIIQQQVRQPFHSFAGTFRADRSFHGVGPSISWNSSVPFVGTPQDGALSVDWGVNAALLFGRQKTTTQHHTTGHYNRAITYQHATPDRISSRNITVPNVGGFAGLSFQYVDAKLSLGYRADFFFGAIDGGVDARKSENRGFFGPFASISIGLGD